jgi:SAM-dependent methyltransferase
MQKLNDKAEARKHWDQDPCGAVTAGDAPVESATWYESIRQYRFVQYAPWMPKAMGFDRWKDRDVLEIGVGMGSDHLSFAQAGARMHALDLATEHLRHTRQHLAIHGLQTQSVLGDAERNPYSDASFDLVYSFGVIHHTPDPARAVQEIYRVLRPGGTALIGLYHRDSWFFWLQVMLRRGILLGVLPRKGWRRLLADIEYHRPGNEAVPLVRLFTRHSARRLFAGFQEVSLSVHHVEATHIVPWLLDAVPRDTLERWLGFGGWYVVIRAVKSAA